MKEEEDEEEEKFSRGEGRAAQDDVGLEARGQRRHLLEETASEAFDWHVLSEVHLSPGFNRSPNPTLTLTLTLTLTPALTRTLTLTLTSYNPNPNLRRRRRGRKRSLRPPAGRSLRSYNRSRARLCRKEQLPRPKMTLGPTTRTRSSSCVCVTALTLAAARSGLKSPRVSRDGPLRRLAAGGAA